MMLRPAGICFSTAEKETWLAPRGETLRRCRDDKLAYANDMRLSLSINSLRLIAWIAVLPVASAAQTPMKAIVIHSSGGPEVLKYEDEPRPQAKDDDIFIRVMAAAVNPVDVFIREGRINHSPLIPGMDVAGVVEETGNKVTKFKRGDAIYAYLSVEEQGGYAEFAVPKQDHAALKPKSVDFEHAAAVPLATTTAWQALIENA